MTFNWLCDVVPAKQTLLTRHFIKKKVKILCQRYKVSKTTRGSDEHFRRPLKLTLKLTLGENGVFVYDLKRLWILLKAAKKCHITHHRGPPEAGWRPAASEGTAFEFKAVDAVFYVYASFRVGVKLQVDDLASELLCVCVCV